MPKKRKYERVIANYFTWIVGSRSGVFYADGRSNAVSAGRHSLGTKDHDEAMLQLRELDRVCAVRLGLADRSILESTAKPPLMLAGGWDRYRLHVSRSRVAGGAKASTVKRYRAVFDKFIRFAAEHRIRSWNEVGKSALLSYAAWLDEEGYAYATEYLELTTLKQAIKWFVDEGDLPRSAIVCLQLSKPVGTGTYCWTADEVRAMVDRCRSHHALAWLGEVLVALACTGLRISELGALRWSDIDWEANVISIRDESTQAHRRNNRQPRETKTGRGRCFPIHRDFRAVLEGMSRCDDGSVFHGPKGGKLKPDTVRRVLIRDVILPLAKRFPTPKGETGFKDGRLHSFRHFFCSVSANNGVPEQVVMEWLGHRDSRMVRHYYHLHDEEAQRQMNRLDILGPADAERERATEESPPARS